MLVYYLIAVNILGLAIMGWDKAKAKLNGWRVPEKTLFLVAVIGGSAGVFAGMRLFRHKTKHMQFVIGIPLILLLHVVLVLLLLSGKISLPF